jgi:GST-like protein
MATFPWARLWERQGQDIAQFPNMKRWLDVIAARPAVQRGLAIRSEDRGRVDLAKDEEARKILFGQKAR